MRPGGIRAASGLLALGLGASVNAANAQPLSTIPFDRMAAMPPLAIALGAIAFAPLPLWSLTGPASAPARYSSARPASCASCGRILMRRKPLFPDCPN